jgi:hypothetical protein
VARRLQSNYSGGETRVTAIDAYGKWTQNVSRHGRPFVLVAEAEAAAIVGTTGLGPTPEFESHDILQFGFLGRVSFGEARWGTVLDFLYASGDQNMDDGQVNNFKADRNIEMGQLLFRHCLTAITARSTVTASNPDLVGKPSKDLDRLPTRGALTNTISIFPRFWWRVAEELTAYAGPLFAFASVATIDPLNSRTGGGAALNAYNGQPSAYLGTELNLGMRYTPEWRKTHFLFGAEAAHFTPGSAFLDTNGQRPSPISGARLFVGYML